MFNQVILIGNLTRNVELKYTQGGSAIAKFGLAVNRKWKDRNTGEKREEVMYIDINIFGRSAEIANQHLSVGKRILVQGRIQFEQWTDQQGQERSKHSISCESFQFLDARTDNQGGASQYTQGQDYTPPAQDNQGSSQNQNNNSSTNQIEIDDDSIPF